MKSIVCITLLLACLSCDFDKPIEIKIPANAGPSTVFECYLQDNTPYRVLLTRADSYFDPLSNPMLEGATVSIGPENSSPDILNYSPFYNPKTGKFYNYRSFYNIELQAGQTYNLKVRLPDGQSFDGQTTVLPMINFDTLRWFYRTNDSSAAIRMRFKDPDLSRTNYFHVMINLDSLTGVLDRSYEFDDTFFRDGSAYINTGYRYRPRRKLFVRLLEVEKKYYDFYESKESAQNANGNPFAQPAPVRSMLNGKSVVGVFAALMPNTQVLVIGKK